ncbi:MAG: lysophospholipid acyltransferase family protein [Candidatus Symbiothrix sp.]|jgi:KDO2-lipid IV(A) lauroyltransferase|nr:lysophospholipid acyltransferase family protein [Candidatus Symbiothrix sp.]
MILENIKYRLLKSVWILLSIIPLRIMYILSDGLFYPLYYIGRYRRKITRKNLVESFPEKSAQEIVTIEKRFYHFFVDIIFEMCKYATISKEDIGKRMKFTNIDEINAVLQQGKSISLYLGHYGNWEWVSSMPLYLNKNTVSGQIYHRLHNQTVDRLLLQNRGRLGATSVEMAETLRWINEHVRNQQVTITGYIADQSPKKSNTQHFVHFLNHQAPALTGAEKITKKYRFEAFFLDIERTKRGYYEATFVKMHADPQSLPDFELTDIYYELLEKMIRKQPELYLWTHKRFKHATLIQQDSQLQ